MLFDITSKQSSIKFLCDFLDSSREIIEGYIDQNKDEVCVDGFLEYTDTSLVTKNIDSIFLSVIHVTTNDDECRSIKENGLVNLQEALKLDTPLRRYLKQCNIQFDLSNELMFINSKCYKLQYDSSFFKLDTIEGQINSVARKIYYDHQINGFFCIQDPKRYGGYVHQRPEILCDLARLRTNPNEFEKEWLKKSKAYVIKFNAPVEYFTFYSFYNDKDEYKKDENERLLLKKWLVEKALRVIWGYHRYNECTCEIMAYVKPEVSIPFNLITEIELLS